VNRFSYHLPVHVEMVDDKLVPGTFCGEEQRRGENSWKEDQKEDNAPKQIISM
jgi:hypothetical protein